MPWPLEPQAGLKSFAAGLETLMVIEHKRPLIETAGPRRPLRSRRPTPGPRIVGKTDEAGHPLLSELGSLSVARCGAGHRRPTSSRAAPWSGSTTISPGCRPPPWPPVTLAAEQQRKPFFCSGCPHNSSTRLPEGSRALAGIGCHYMASFSDPQTDLNSHMGGEGLTWVGSAPFTTETHVFVNLGDGTYNPLRLAGDPRAPWPPTAT